MIHTAASRSFFHLTGKLLAVSEFMGWGSGAGRITVSLVARFCEALFVTRRCRKLDSDEVLGSERGYRRHSSLYIREKTKHSSLRKGPDWAAGGWQMLPSYGSLVSRGGG